VPPQTTPDLALERGEAKAHAVAVQAEGLGDADGEAVKYPKTFALAMDLER